MIVAHQLHRGAIGVAYPGGAVVDVGAFRIHFRALMVDGRAVQVPPFARWFRGEDKAGGRFVKMTVEGVFRSVGGHGGEGGVSQLFVVGPGCRILPVINCARTGDDAKTAQMGTDPISSGELTPLEQVPKQAAFHLDEFSRC